MDVYFFSMETKGRAEIHTLELNITESEFRKRIALLKEGYKKPSGTFYLSSFDDGSFGLFINGARGNMYSPVFRFVPKFTESKETSITGRFYFRKFTLNYLFLWLLAIVSMAIFSLSRCLSDLLSGTLNVENGLLLFYPFLFLVMLILSVITGRKRFENDSKIILSNIRILFF